MCEDMDEGIDLELTFDDPIPMIRRTNIAVERWDRAREHADIREILERLTGNPANVSAISCPLGHGRGSADSRPSFYIYPQTNSCYCFGCPPDDNYFDPIRLVSKIMEISPSKALTWIENNIELPNLDIEMDDDNSNDEGEKAFTINVDELREPFVKFCHNHVRREPNLDNAKFFIQTYWRAVSSNNPILMAQVIGAKGMEDILGRS